MTTAIAERRALVTARGLNRPISAALVRQLCAKQFGCSPFQILVERGHCEKTVGTFEVVISGISASEAPSSSTSLAIVRIEQNLPAVQHARVMSRLVRAIPHLLSRIDRPTWSRYQAGRPLIVAAHSGFGTCRLARFSEEDFRIYRFASPQARQAAYRAFTIAQDLLSQTCVELGCDTGERPGCVLSMAAGAAVGL